jgi:hypothetical protein
MKQLILFLCVIIALSAYAQMPRTLNYQGTLATGSTPVPDGNYNVTFRLYTASSGGSAVWTEAQLVSARNGVFNAVLGKIVALPASFNITYWLSLQVGADPELSPRLEMTGVSYSMHSAASDSAEKVRDGSITAAKIAGGAVTNAKLADASVTSAKIVDGTITGADIAAATINSTHIIDEPGVSSSIHNGRSLDAGNILYVIDSVDITLTTPGFVVVFASGLVYLNHTGGEATGVNIAVSQTTTTIPAYGRSYAYLSSTVPTQGITFPFCTHMIFDVPLGYWKFYLLANYMYGSLTTTTVSSTRLTAMYFPTQRGVISAPPAEPPPLNLPAGPTGTSPANR